MSVGLVAMHRCHGTLAGLVLRLAGTESAFTGHDVGFHLVLENAARAPRQRIEHGTARQPQCVADVPAAGTATALLKLRAGRRGRVPLDRFVVATKCFFPVGPGPFDRGNSRRHVLESIDASLSRLRTDYIDLFQVHAYDAETPVEETLQALDEATRAGKIRHAGCSNHLAWELAQACWTADRLGIRERIVQLTQ